MYNKSIVLKKEVRNKKYTGYLYFIDIQHPLSSAVGRVYHHRHIVSINIGRWLNSKEHVHHKDGNKGNNDYENLEIMTVSEHNRLHRLLESGNTKISKCCKICGIEFKTYTGKKEKIYCSIKCRSEDTRKVKRPSKEELEDLIKNNSFVALGKMFNVSDNAIRKWAKIYEIL